MPVDLSCPCGANYCIQDAFAGQPVQCDACGEILDVPQKDPSPDFLKGQTYLIHKQYFSLSEVFTVEDQTSRAQLRVVRPRRVIPRIMVRILIPVVGFFLYAGVLAFSLSAARTPYDVLRAAKIVVFVSIALSLLAPVLLRPRRHIWFFAEDDSLLFWICHAKRIQSPTALFLLVDPAGHVIARARRNAFQCILKRTWQCEDPQGRTVCIAEEDSAIRSIGRRLFAKGIFSGLERTTVHLNDPETCRVLGTFSRRLGLIDRYDLDLSTDQEGKLDRRVALSLCVLMDCVG